jgi:hypothetical protein
MVYIQMIQKMNCSSELLCKGVNNICLQRLRLEIVVELLQSYLTKSGIRTDLF